MNQKSDSEIHQAIGEAVARAEDASGAAALAAAASIDPPEPSYSIFDLKFALSEHTRLQEAAEHAKKEYEDATNAVQEHEQKLGKIHAYLRDKENLADRFVIRQAYDIVEVSIYARVGIGKTYYTVHQDKLNVL